MTYGSDAVHYPDPVSTLASDLTKREYFAAMALQGILSNERLCSKLIQAANDVGQDVDEWIAIEAQKSADGLIRRLNYDDIK